jgi:hypothetical protein
MYNNVVTILLVIFLILAILWLVNVNVTVN